jgi:hypothetical protein
MDQESIALEVLPPQGSNPKTAVELDPQASFRLVGTRKDDGTVVEQPQDDWFGVEVCFALGDY